MTDQSGSTLIGQRYQILRELGAGNMGAVFEAVDRLSGQFVALKQVKVPAAQLEYGSRSDQSADLSLAQEFRILASLRHPNIISVLDYGFDRQASSRTPFFTMELLETGESFLDVGERLSTDGRIDLIVQMLRAIQYLHRRGILHRDLKPKNVLVVDRLVKVLDFGLSIAHDQAQGGEIAGTPSYMAPELWIGGKPSRESDLYAVGVMAFRVLSGAAPFDSSNLKILFQETRSKIPDYSLLNAPEAVRRVVARLMEKEPADRYSDAGDVIHDLLAGAGLNAEVETAATRESFLQAASLVGREREMTLLSDRLSAAATGRGGMVLVSGESGVGKSRLIDELRTLALVQGTLVLRGQADEAVTTPNTLWRSVLRWLALLEAVNDRQASILKAVVPDIGRLLGRDVPDPPEVIPEAAQARLQHTVIDLIERIASESAQTLLILLEDLHWADAESLHLLRRLTTAIGNLRVLIIATFRDDDAPELAESFPLAELLRVERLNPQQTADLTTAILGERGNNESLVTLLQRETEGNTFFLVEMMRALAEEAGQLSAVGSTPLPLSVITGGVSGIIQRRLSRVPERARPLLELAAVGGRMIDTAVVKHILEQRGLAESFDLWLSDGADAAVFDIYDGQWRFSHNKLREGALKAIDPARFQLLSQELARAVEAVYEVSTRQNADLLAHYWRGAGNAEKEEQYAAQAGEQALRAGAYSAAIGHLERAIELQAHVEAARRKGAMLRQQLGDAYRGIGQHDKAAALYSESLQTCREIGYRWGVASNLNRMGMLLAENGRAAEGVGLLVESLRTAMEARAQPVALGTLVSMGSLMARSGRPGSAAELAAVALNHVASDGTTHYLAERLVDTLRSAMSEAELSQALERGRQLELREVAERILSASA